jgi:hypothetical protein
MSGQNWSIVITPPAMQGQPAMYTPDLMGVRPGDPLQAGNADIISWNNRTNDLHQPVAVVNGVQTPLSDPIQPFRSSRPGYVTTASTTTTVTTIDYTCSFHPNESGRILVYNT